MLAPGSGQVGLRPTSVSDVRSGKPHDPEKQRLADIIDRLNDLYSAEVSVRQRYRRPHRT